MKAWIFALALCLVGSSALAVPQGTPNANGIGALAIGSALSELAKAGSQAAARANLGLGALSTLSKLDGLDAGAALVKALGASKPLTAAQRAGLRLTAMDLEAKGDCSTDDTLALQRLFAVGGFLPAAPGGCYKVTATLQPMAGVEIVGTGPTSLIKLVLPPGSAAIPVIDTGAAGAGVTLRDFGVDGNSSGLVASTIYKGNVIASSAVLLQGDDDLADGLTVRNAFDNGISVVQINTSTGVTTAGSPVRAMVLNSRTFNNGKGTGGGTGVDVGSGSRVLIANSIDNGSCNGFQTDIGAGASGVMTNLISNSPSDCTGTVSSGNNYYLASSNWSYQGLYGNFAPNYGFWLDSAGVNNVASSIEAINSGLSGLYIKSPGYTLQGILVQNASSKGQGQSDAVLVDTGSVPVIGLQMQGVVTTGSLHRYGYNETGVNSVSVSCTACKLNGATAPVGPGTLAGTTTVVGVLSVGKGGEDNPITLSGGKAYDHKAQIGTTANGASDLQLVSGGNVAMILPADGAGAILPKVASTPSAPGPANLRFFALAGATAGTCRLVALAGTSTTPVTIADNIGSGC